MAVFDYYNDANVKARYQQVYQAVMWQLRDFALQYDTAYNNPQVPNSGSPILG
jgi:hypothetical protein